MRNNSAVRAVGRCARAIGWVARLVTLANELNRDWVSQAADAALRAERHFQTALDMTDFDDDEDPER